MDLWKIAGNKEIGPGGIRCTCCTPLTRRWKRARSKQIHHQATRSRLRNELRKVVITKLLKLEE